MLEWLFKLWERPEQKEEMNLTEAVTNAELRRCLDNLALEEKNVLRDVPKGSKAYRNIIQTVLKIQLALKAYTEIIQITLPIAKSAVELATLKEKLKKEAEYKNVKSDEADHERLISWNVSYLAEQIKDFEVKYSPRIAESMRKAVRVTMLKLAARFRVSKERISLLKKKNAWFV